MNTTNAKKCSTCKTQKNIDEFYYSKSKGCYFTSCKSCEAIRSKRSYLARPAEYGSWKKMKERCYDPKHNRYYRYGGRGISVCDKWRNSFKSFIADMGPRPTRKHQIDRIDNDGNYEPSNCRWATVTQNNRNRSDNIVNMSIARSIRWHYGFGGYRIAELVLLFSLREQSVSDIVHNRTWKEPSNE